MEPTLDQVREELAEIYEQLMVLPADDFDTRSKLKDRQNELRQLSAQLIEGQPLHSQEALKAAYERLAKVRDRLLDQHLDTASTSIGDAGIEGEFVQAVNKAMDQGLGVEEIEDRLKEILEQLKSAG